MQACLELIPDDTERVFVAYSGGLDSSMLLHLLVSKPRDYQVIPWHFNHGLLDVASEMEQFCVAQAEAYGLELRIDHLQLDNADGNIEATARRQRYQLFERHTGSRDCILTAHHADDQAETFLLNALRGSGSAGLRGIAQLRPLGNAVLLRPLLDYSRAQLEDYCNQYELTWFNDPSNQDNRFDRNYLRNEVIPKVKLRWPKFPDALLTTSKLQAETQDLLDEVAGIDLERVKTSKSAGLITLKLPEMLLLTPGRRKNLVRYWIADAGLPTVPQARLEELMKQMQAKADALPEIAMPEYSIRIYDQRLFLVRAGSLPDCSGEFGFGVKPEIKIEALDLQLPRKAIFEQIKIDDEGQALTLKFRDSGKDNVDRHRLKRLFQRYRVPPWERATVAQVYLDDKLVGLLW